jgi:hypothetical protein
MCMDTAKLTVRLSKAMIDLNVLLDVIQKREPHFGPSAADETDNKTEFHPPPPGSDIFFRGNRGRGAPARDRFFQAQVASSLLASCRSRVSNPSLNQL